MANMYVPLCEFELGSSEFVCLVYKSSSSLMLCCAGLQPVRVTPSIGSGLHN
jgi:hypothetical protein